MLASHEQADWHLSEMDWPAKQRPSRRWRRASSAHSILAPLAVVSANLQLRSLFSGLFFNLITKRYDRHHETLL